MLISDAYLDQQRQLHAAPKGYGGKGAKWADVVEGLIGEFGAFWTLDYGAGRGSLGREIQGRGHRIANYDPAIAGWEAAPTPCDLVVCTDVLEHVEPDCIEAVLDDLKRVTLRTAFVVVSLVPAQKQLPDGRNAHILIRPRAWWMRELARRFDFDREVPCRAHKEFAAVWRTRP